MQVTLLRLTLLVLSAISSFPALAVATDAFHLDRNKLPYACSTCHVGFDFRAGGGATACLGCHGNSSRLPQSRVAKGIELRDIETEVKKLYRHPVLESPLLHSSNETLPETDSRAPRHATCVDCHNPHYVSPGNRFAGIRGKRVGNLITEITKECEICYRCHGESANLPGRSTNKKAEFSTSNPSFHPVEGEGRNMTVISLLKPYKEKKVTGSDVSTITCTTCHGSDSPDAPQGPHGSIYQYILTDNYSTKDGEAESQFAYALCYRCHSRTSILNDESFRFHSLHIKGRGNGAWGPDGTSCHTCHTSHGSTEYKYLINFNTDIVSPNSRGILKFSEKGNSSFRGECYLSCHGVDHAPKSY